jgi:hypothetical protein
VVAAVEHLQWDQRGIVVQAEPDRLCGGDLRRAGRARNPLPAEAGYLEPLGNPSSWANMTRYSSKAPLLVQSGSSGLLPQSGGYVYGPWLTNAMHCPWFLNCG